MNQANWSELEIRATENIRAHRLAYQLAHDLGCEIEARDFHLHTSNRLVVSDDLFVKLIEHYRLSPKRHKFAFSVELELDGEKISVENWNPQYSLTIEYSCSESKLDIDGHIIPKYIVHR